MRALWVAGLLATGCDLALGLELRDAPPPDDPPDAAAGHDEDSDGHPDVTDNCPSSANPMQTADANELVGIVCDPHRGQAGDQILRSASAYFAQDLEPAAITSGTWAVVSDAAKTTSATTNTDASLKIDFAGTRTSLMVEMSFILRDHEPSDSFVDLKVTVGMASYFCSIREDDVSTPASAGRLEANGQIVGDWFPPGSTLNTPHRLSLRIDPSAAACELDGDRSRALVGPFVTGPVTVVARMIKKHAEIQSIVIYETP